MLIRVQPANGSVYNTNYSLTIGGTAHYYTNQCPIVPSTDYITIGEAKTYSTDAPEDAYDPDGQALTLHLHSDWYGRATVPDETRDDIVYRAGTSIIKDHKVTYVVDDGHGGRAKGTIVFYINPLSPAKAFSGSGRVRCKYERGTRHKSERDPSLEHCWNVRRLERCVAPFRKQSVRLSQTSSYSPELGLLATQRVDTIFRLISLSPARLLLDLESHYTDLGKTRSMGMAQVG